MYTLTFTIANATNADVFRVFEQDTDDVIDVANYLIEKGEQTQPSNGNTPASGRPKQRAQDEIWKYI